MGKPIHPLNIFNGRYLNQRLNSTSLRSGSNPACPTFSRFRDLPNELRINIWTWHLQYQRFLRVQLEDIGTKACSDNQTGELALHNDHIYKDSKDTLSSSARLENHNSACPEALSITFLDDSIGSVPDLPLVCHEAYEVYKSFYRIRLPCFARVPRQMRSGSGSKSHAESGFETRRVVAYLHPDYDIISLETLNPPEVITSKLLPFFLHTLLMHDSSPVRLRFGVRNLCLDLKQLGASRNAVDDEDDDGDRDLISTAMLPAEVLISVRATILHLRNLYLRLTTKHQEPRVTTGPLIGSGALPWYNASMPVLPLPSWQGFSSQLQLVGRDIRLQEPEDMADLRQVWIGSHIKPSIEVWEDLQRAWGIHRGDRDAGEYNVSSGRELNIRALIAQVPEGSVGIKEFMHKEQAEWNSLMNPASRLGMLLLPLFVEAQQRFLAESAPSIPLPISPDNWFMQRSRQTVAGFWLVDSAVLDGVKSTGYPGKKVADLSGVAKAVELWAFESRINYI